MATYQRRAKDISDFRERAIIRQRQSQFGSLRLTTVRYPIVTMATQAAELALALADNRPLPEITNVFSPTLVRRHSVSTPSLV